MAVNPASPGRVTKGILQPTPKYQSRNYVPAADNRDDAFVRDHRGRLLIPESYVETIRRGFGETVDLYEDVLKISPEVADDSRQLRICYFRRGREVLTEAGVRGLEGLSTSQDIPDLAKTRFQAVSMAYDILAKPEWKELYDRQGLEFAKQRQLTTLHRPRIRWNEQVEELVYEREPHEQAEMMEWSNQRKRKKSKPRVMIGEDDEELDEYLAKLDAEASPTFQNDFLDTIEESWDGLLKFAGSSRGSSKADTKSSNDDSAQQSDSSDKQPEDNSLADEELPPAIQTTTSKDEDSLVGMLASHIMRLNARSSVGSTSTHEASLVPLSHEEATDPFRCVSPDPSRPTSPDDELFDVAADRAAKAKAADDVFDGIDDDGVAEQPSSITVPTPRSVSPSNLSTVSDLSESVATARPSQKSAFALPGGSVTPDQSAVDTSIDQSSAMDTSFSVSTSVARDIFSGTPEDDEFSEQGNNWFKPSQIAKNFSFDGSEKDTEAVVVTPEKSSSSDDEGFIAAFAAFIHAMAMECVAMGQNLSETDWKEAVVGAFLIEEADVDQLISIVATEVQHTPALDTNDAVQSPTMFAIEAARSFS